MLSPWVTGARSPGREALRGCAGLSCHPHSDFPCKQERSGGQSGEQNGACPWQMRFQMTASGNHHGSKFDPWLSRLQLSEENKALFPLPLPPPQPQATSAPTWAAQIVVCHGGGPAWGSGSDSPFSSIWGACHSFRYS